MIKNPRIRRSIAATLVVLGGILMFFATDIWQGVVLLAAGVILELIGIALKHKNS